MTFSTNNKSGSFIFFTSLAFGIIAWVLTSFFYTSPLLPKPFEVLMEICRILTSTSHIIDITWTFLHITLGLLFSIIIALILSILGFRFRLFQNALKPWISIFQSCPSIVWIVIFMISFGTGSVIPILSVFIMTLPGFYSSFLSGFTNIDKKLLSMASLYGVSVLRTFLHLILPGSKAVIVPSLVYSVGISWKVATMSEFVSSNHGIGARLYASFRILDVNQVFSWGIIVVVLSLILDQILGKFLWKKTSY